MWRWNVLCLPIALMFLVCGSGEGAPSQPTSVSPEDSPPVALLKTGSLLGSLRQASPTLYPNVLYERPAIRSPYVMEDGTEILTAVLIDGKYVCIPVTVENGKPLHYSRRVASVYGKDQQLHVNHHDFPTLARTGLHAEAELDGKNMITGLSPDLITYIGRPGRFSGAGFMADDETVVSVLKGDNDLVRTLGLTHPQMAKPLFHVWNMILREIECGKLARFSGIQRFFYNGNEVHLRAEGTKGWQVSIFQDEIQGRFDIDVRRTLSSAERSFLQEKYSCLSDCQRADLEDKIAHLHFSEMAPYYIMRYGFYEGHTDYRADPIAIACIFQLKTIEEIEEAFPGSLHRVLADHFAEDDAGQ